MREGSDDIALLYDVLHALTEPHLIWLIIRRVLKTNAVLSIIDHHMKEASLLPVITSDGLFLFSGSNRGTFRFVKARTIGVTL